MFIAFEGPDNTGKSTSALRLDCAGQPDYNATREMHLQNVADWQGDPYMPHTYDRIDWFTHMVYRLALPTRDWNDARPRTVFAMPDTHLVFKVHDPNTVPTRDEEEGYKDGQPAAVNQMYFYFADYFMNLNRQQDFALFKSISIVEVSNNGSFRQTLVEHDSAGLRFGSAYVHAVDTDDRLLAFLQHVEAQIG